MAVTASLPKRRKRNVREDLTGSTGPTSPRVDRDKGIIYDVKLVGLRSKNGGTYPIPVLQRRRELYEGVRSYINHPPRDNPKQDRPFETFFGEIHNAHVVESEGLFGDLHFLKSHEEAERVCEAAERFPRSFGLSHNASVIESVGDNGELIYEDIEAVRSVDVVARPATTAGIFESERLESMNDNSGAGTANVTEDDEGDGGAYGTAVQGVLDEHMPKILGSTGKEENAEHVKEMGRKLKGLHRLLKPEPKTEEKPAADASKPAGEPDGDEVEESEKKCLESIAELTAAKIPVTAVRVRLLNREKTPAARKAVLESWQGTGVATTPGTPPAEKPKPHSMPADVTESVAGGASKDQPKDASEAARRMRA